MLWTTCLSLNFEPVFILTARAQIVRLYTDHNVLLLWHLLTLPASTVQHSSALLAWALCISTVLAPSSDGCFYLCRPLLFLIWSVLFFRLHFLSHAECAVTISMYCIQTQQHSLASSSTVELYRMFQHPPGSSCCHTYITPVQDAEHLIMLAVCGERHSCLFGVGSGKRSTVGKNPIQKYIQATSGTENNVLTICMWVLYLYVRDLKKLIVSITKRDSLLNACVVVDKK